MFGWLKKLGGRAPRAAGLDEKSLERLADDFEDLDKLQGGVGEKAFRYVVQGEGTDILQKLPGVRGASQALGLRCLEKYTYGDKAGRRHGFFGGVRLRDGGFFLRLARVWEAASRSDTRHLHAELPAPDLEWLEIFLMEATGFLPNSSPSPYLDSPSVDALQIEAMMEADGKSPELLLRCVFHVPTTDYWKLRMQELFSRLRGFAERASRRTAVVLEALAQPSAEARVHALNWMEKTEVDPAAFAERLAELAVSPSKQVRERSEAFLKKVGPKAVPLVERQAREGGNDERIQAVKLLWRFKGEDARPFLESRLTDEKNKRVLEAIREFVASPGSASTPSFALPPLAELPAHAPLPAEARAALRSCLEKIETELAKAPAQQKGRRAKGKELGAWAADEIVSLLETLDVEKAASIPRFDLGYHDVVWKPVRDFLERTDVKPVHVVRLAVVLGQIKLGGDLENRLEYKFSDLIEGYQRGHPPGISLRDLGAVFKAVGLNPKTLGITRLKGWSYQTFGLSLDQVWPYYVEHLDLIQAAFAPSTDWWQSYRRKKALEILSHFAQPPAEMLPLLWDLALGAKTERLPAQTCLERSPDTLPRVIASLAQGRAEVRGAAAEWLARLRERTAVEPLLAAVRKEKNEAAKGEMMSALEALGVPVDQFLDRKALLEEARKGLSKDPPSALEGFPFPAMPAVHWADDGSPVGADVLRWFVVQACRLKDPEPGVLLRKYCALFKAGEREALGEFVLASWIELDTAPIPQADAEKQARAEAKAMAQYSRQFPNIISPKTEEEFYAAALPRWLRNPRDSAIASKGVLAIAGACGGPSIAPLVARYLKEWYGLRSAQSKALVQMLGWVEHPAAIQLVLAVGNRFRTKGIQDEAARQAQAIADRKGWSLEELADRTIPSAGFDEAGEMTLDYGPRQFKAKLGDDLEITLTNPEGKTIPSPPDPRAGDDEALAKEAKKNFSGARKELKAVLKMQGDRLYEAMCIQRGWRFEDWSLYLNRHPIVRHLCGRLVWTVAREGAAPVTFRPLPDGSLTSAEDEGVQVDPEEVVRLAHDCNTPPDVSKAWAQHVGDYEVEPLFQQFGRPRFALAEERKRDTEVGDFLGHLLDAFALRNRATKLGYTRGRPEDGGWFYSYSKRFPTLGLEATIEFTGNNLPEENRKVALRSLGFERISPDGQASQRLPLGELPSVLLSECWNDLRSLAADGPGFDPDWETKTAP